MVSVEPATSSNEDPEKRDEPIVLKNATTEEGKSSIDNKEVFEYSEPKQPTLEERQAKYSG